MMAYPMTENVGGKKSVVAGFRDDFKALSTKQLLAILAAIAIALLLEYMGMTSQCLGVLIIAVVLYMIPHFLKVMSVRVKPWFSSSFSYFVTTLPEASSVQTKVNSCPT